MAIAASAQQRTIETDIPARLDRLPWSRWHWLIVIALGITWVIDGLEVTLVGAIGTILQEPESLDFTATQVGLLNTWYLVGAVIGAIAFGYLTDRLGRKKLFTVTLGLYLAAAFLTAFSWNFASFAFFRFLTGAGIGGEYAAINSAIDELIPARMRGWVDLAINGTFWLGAGCGSLATVLLLDPRWFSVDMGWRFGFGIGAAVGVVILFLRHWIPESPRWLLFHGKPDEAEQIVAEVERSVHSGQKPRGPIPDDQRIAIRPGTRVGFADIISTLFRKYPRRTVLGLTLIVSQAFLYNGVAFSFALILRNFEGVQPDRVGLYLLPFALTNFLGPLLLGSLFDTVGRKPMIAGTLVVTAALLVLNGVLFAAGVLSAVPQTALWALMFFFASAAASSAYLTVSEIFPIEMRGLVIAFFYAVGTGLGGPFASWFFGRLIDTRSRQYLAYGNFTAAALLVGTAIVVLAFGIKAERASLETVASPLSAAEKNL